MLIQAEDLGYIYALRTPAACAALEGVSLEINSGERVGIVGATGSGKSTLVQLLAGLLVPTSGRVLLDGVVAHVRTPEARARRRRVGFAFQYPEDQIFEQTVFKEVAFGPRNLGLGELQIADRVRWALDIVGLDAAEIKQRVPFGMSGGELRRIALAGILAMHPEVLILDEPTAGLDPRGRRELLARLIAWQQESGATLIAISHDLNELARLADRLFVLVEGRIVAHGAARQILTDTHLLTRAGLAAPQPVMLLEALRRSGWDVKTDRLWPEEVVAEIVRAWRSRQSLATPVCDTLESR